MDETKIYSTSGFNSSSWVWGFVIFLLILFVAIFSLLGHRETRDNNNSSISATCAAEKQNIIDTARTQYLTEQQAAQTRELISSTANATQTKIDFYAYQDLRDKLSESQRENMMLQNKLFVQDQLAPITSQLSSIQCNMLRRPDVTGVGVACPNAAILNGLGINSFNNGCGGCGGCNGNSSLV